MENRAAHRYAKALLELSLEKGVLEEVHNDMKDFVEICNQSRDLELMLKSPIVPHFKKFTIMEALFKGKVHPVTFSIFEIITKKNREEILREIAESFHLQYNVFNKIQPARIITTFALDESLRKEFADMVQKISGKQVELAEKVDAELIGGYVLQIGDTQIDESVRSKLRKLKMDLGNLN
ncbi:MAG: ATP synthase F1 subunit delta [Verrucomicrobia bacterium]|nr:ATP synthase F1 subunit delta [Cytophagales bacterium]